MAVRLIPGAVGKGSLRGLVMSDGAVQPVVAVSPAAGVVMVTPVAPDSLLAAKLAPLRLWAFDLTGLSAGTSYSVTATAGAASTEPVPFTTIDPTASAFTIVAASCYYDFFHNGALYWSVLRSSFCKQAALKLLIGDNLYMDVHPRQDDFTDADEETAYLYKHYFWGKEANLSNSLYPEALSVLPTLTTWDDHEIWNNAPERQLHLSRSRGNLRESYLRAARAGVDAFQRPLNPTGLGGTRSYRVDDFPLVSLFMLDARLDRSLHNEKPLLFAPENAIAAFEGWAKGLKVPGVFVVGQPIYCGTGSGLADYWPADYEDHYVRIWRAIHDSPWQILLLTGDVHHSRACTYHFKDGRTVHEIVTSPAAHIPTVWSVAGGSYGTQDQGKVHFPDLVRVKSDYELTLSDYWFGTDVKNTIATIDFEASGNGTVDVGCTFIDLETKTVPRPVHANDKFLTKGIAPKITDRCQSSRVFTLEKRF